MGTRAHVEFAPKPPGLRLALLTPGTDVNVRLVCPLDNGYAI